MKFFEDLKAKLEGLELEAEKVDELVEFSKKSIPKEFVPSEKYNEKVEELNNTNTKLEEVNTAIEDLKNSSENVDEYKSKIEELNNEFSTYKDETESRVSNMKKTSLLKDRLLNDGADKDNIDLLLKDFNIDEMKLKDDNIIGLDDYVNPVKEKRSRFYTKDKIEDNKPEDGEVAKSGDEELSSLRQAMGLSIEK